MTCLESSRMNESCLKWRIAVFRLNLYFGLYSDFWQVLQIFSCNFLVFLFFILYLFIILRFEVYCTLCYACTSNKLLIDKSTIVWSGCVYDEWRLQILRYFIILKLLWCKTTKFHVSILIRHYIEMKVNKETRWDV